METFVSSVLAFIVSLGVIIFVHEFGHLVMAKAFGVRAHVFSLGFGKRLWGFRRGGTDYRVSLVPLGGYVKLAGETAEEATGDEADFLSRPRWQRVAVYFAGPAMNVVLAIVLVAVVFMIGTGVPPLHEMPPVVGTVLEGSAAAAAGLAPGDRIVEIDGTAVEEWDDFEMIIFESPERRLSVVFERDGESSSTVLVPAKDTKYGIGVAGIYAQMQPRIARVFPDGPAAGAGFVAGDVLHAVDGRPVRSSQDFVQYVHAHLGQGIEVEVAREESRLIIEVTPEDSQGRGRIGIELTHAMKLGLVDALVASVRFNVELTVRTFSSLGKIFSRKVKVENALSGPLEIGILMGAAARRGLPDLLLLMGVVSVSIAILNLLPIPVLDGGHILILTVESLMRRDLSLRLKESVSLMGLGFIVLLMVMALFFDIRRNIPLGRDTASDTEESEGMTPVTPVTPTSPATPANPVTPLTP